MKKYHLTNRPNRELKDAGEIKNILRKGKFVVISMCRSNEPYIVTLSYGYDADKNSLYFHCARNGLKLDFLSENSTVCATVIEDKGYIDDTCSHAYKTVVFWGDMKKVSNLDEKKYGMNVLLHHLEKKHNVIKEKMIAADECYANMEILRLDIKQIHGKAGQ